MIDDALSKPPTFNVILVHSYARKLARNGVRMRIGTPSASAAFVKIGKAVLYPIEELDVWDGRNLVACDDAKVGGRRRLRSDGEPCPVARIGTVCPGQAARPDLTGGGGRRQRGLVRR
jgi:hypothetical protein